jgi:hypothetical protein
MTQVEAELIKDFDHGKGRKLESRACRQDIHGDWTNPNLSRQEQMHSA